MRDFRDTLALNVAKNHAYPRRVFGGFTVREKDFQAQLMQLVEMLGGLAYHAHDSRREVKRNGERILVGDVDAKGYPDLTIVTLDRRVIFAELKIGKKQPTDSQWIWLRGLPDHQAYLWHGTDWDDAARIIQTGHHSGLPSKSPVMWRREPTCIACQNSQS